MGKCECPAAAALPTIMKADCQFSLGQVQRIGFQRIWNRISTAVKNSIAEADIKDVSEWQALIAANDDTKVTMSPIVSNPADVEPTDRTIGGDNSVPDYSKIKIGETPAGLTGVFREIPQADYSAMKQLECEAAAKNIGVYLFDGQGNVECIEVTIGSGSSAVKEYMPIPLTYFSILPKSHGFGSDTDRNNFELAFREAYSEEVVVKQLGFDPVSEL